MQESRRRYGIYFDRRVCYNQAVQRCSHPVGHSHNEGSL
ncbi:hypothetical protein DPMD02_61 [Desulfofustis phage LS06-2018-MD02]|nr:hypothetical protein DPMD02_61 [Desulfofustis phage LS06-2018-MD02]